MITIGRDGGFWVWHRKTPGMTWTSNERFATLPQAVKSAKANERYKGEFMEPDIEILQDDEPVDYSALAEARECPEEYTEEVDSVFAAQFLASLTD